ncbi:MAG: BPSS1780 family membrane protein [Pseudomonadota bacterium]|nr:BPSS1780 family membrane protein [Pseudomonadota bacterium]
MSDQNPYTPPTAEVADQATGGERELHDPRSVAAGRGWGWIAEGFGYFSASWAVWLGIIVVWAIIMIVLGLIPIVSIVTSLLSAVFMGGVMIGCRALDDGDNLQFGHLFAGFQQRFGPLLGVGGLYLLGVILIGVAFMGVMMGSGGMEALEAIEQAETAGGEIGPEALDTAALGGGMLIGVLAAMLLFIPLIMAFWFAPALVALHEVGALQAMKMSFRGCLKNIVPFLVYGIIVLVLGVIAAIPVFLGWLVLSPVVIGSIYAAYKDIYLYE